MAADLLFFTYVAYARAPSCSLMLYENISWSTSMDFSSGKLGMCSL